MPRLAICIFQILSLLLLAPTETWAKRTDTTDTQRRRAARAAARRSTLVVRYDFKTGGQVMPRVYPWIHQPVVYRLENINRLAYDIKVESRDSIIAENESAAVAAAPITEVTASETDEELSHIREDVAAVRSIVLAAQRKDGAEKPAPSVGAKANKTADTQQASIDGLYAESRKLAAAVSRLKGDTTPESAAKRDSLTQEIDKIEVDANYRRTQITDKERKMRSVRLAAARKEKGLAQQFDTVLNAYRRLQPIYQTYFQLKRISLLPSTDSTTVQKNPELAKLLQTAPLSLQHELVFAFNLEVREYNRRKDAFDAWITEQEGLSPTDQKLLTILPSVYGKEVARLDGRTSGRNLYAMVDSSISLYTLLSSACNYYFVSPPIQPSADLVVFDVSIRSRQTGFYHDTRSFAYRDHVRGGLRYDFSTGLVFNIGVGDMQYRLGTIGMGDSAQVQILENGRTNNYVPQLAAMLHATIRSKNVVNVGFTLGASINTEELDIGSIFPGLSLMVGRRNKAVLTLGPALKRVDYLKSKYDPNTTYRPGDLQEDALTDKTFRVGAFVGISYNLTAQQKSKFRL